MKRKIPDNAFTMREPHLKYCATCRINKINAEKAEKKFKETILHHIKHGLVWKKDYTFEGKSD